MKMIIIILVLAFFLTGCVVKCPQCPSTTCPDHKTDVFLEFNHQILEGECDSDYGRHQDINVSVNLLDGFVTREFDNYILHYPDFYVGVDGRIGSDPWCWVQHFKYNLTISGKTIQDNVQIDPEKCSGRFDCVVIDDINKKLEDGWH